MKQRALMAGCLLIGIAVGGFSARADLVDAAFGIMAMVKTYEDKGESCIPVGAAKATAKAIMQAAKP